MAGKKLLMAVIGLIATGLGILGVWLPGLPTTPLILLALWAFSHSSERLGGWVRRMPMLGHAVAAADHYQRDRNLPLMVKMISQTAAWCSVVVVMVVTRSWWVTGIVGVAAVACTVFMVRTPTRRPAADAGSVPADDGAVRMAEPAPPSR